MKDASIPDPGTSGVSRGGVFLCGAILLGAVLRLYALGRHGLWQDEVSSVLITEDLSLVANPIVGHAPLYYALLAVWRLASDGDTWIRGLSVILGLLVILTTYFVVRREFDLDAGLLAAWCVAISPVQIWASREARAYILMHLLLLLACGAWARARDGGGVRYWVLLAFFAAGSMYTHYYALFGLAALSVCAVLAPRVGTRHLLSFAATMALALALFLPWLPVFLGGNAQLAAYAAEVKDYSTRNTFPMKTGLYLLARSDPPHLLGGTLEALVPGHSFTWLSGAALVALLWAACWRAKSRGDLARLVPWLILALLPTALAVVAGEWRNVFLSTRYLAFNSVFLAVPAAVALRDLRGLPRRAVIASSLALSLASAQPLYQNPVSQIREAVHFIDANAAEGDCVATVSNKAFCYRYFSQRLLPVSDLPWDVPGFRRQLTPGGPLAERAVQAVDLPAVLAHLSTCSTAWILYNEESVWGVDMGATRLRRALADGGFELVKQNRFSDSSVEGYRRKRLVPANASP